MVKEYDKVEDYYADPNVNFGEDVKINFGSTDPAQALGQNVNVKNIVSCNFLSHSLTGLSHLPTLNWQNHVHRVESLTCSGPEGLLKFLLIFSTIS